MSGCDVGRDAPLVIGRSATLARRSAGTFEGDPCHAPATKANDSAGMASLLFKSCLICSSLLSSSFAAANAIGTVRVKLTLRFA